MEEIRAAAMEALFSVPRGGAEIGGVLWGTRTDGRVGILAARPLECEHALGPTFTLSSKDHARLAVLLVSGCDDLRARGWEPVGWYHSHTRSEILLSARDLEIYNRYFPEPWHVALVVRPHAMQPMRAGFFFREANGTIHADSSYGEFLLQPAPRPVAEHPAPQAAVASPPTCPPASHVQRSRQRLAWVAMALGMAAGLYAFKNDRTHVFAAGRPSTLQIADGAVRAVVALDLHLALRQPGGQIREQFTSFIGQAGAPAHDPPTAGLRRELLDQAVRAGQLERAVAEQRAMLQCGPKLRRLNNAR